MTTLSSSPSPHRSWPSLGGGMPVAVALVAAALLAGCQAPTPILAPPSPVAPWIVDERPEERTIASEAEPTLPASQKQTSRAPQQQAAQFSLPANPAAAVFEAAPELPSHPLTLAELIDLAQRHNPLTRMAWEQARLAAVEAGMTESLFLPLISATVVAGWQRFDSPLPYAVGELDEIETTVKGVIPALTLQWLLFDFGEREATRAGARHLAFGANIAFQGAHQRLIEAVALAYYQYEVARSRVEVTTEGLANANTVLEAVQARQAEGMATVVELAMARRQVAQARMLKVQAEGAVRDAYQALIVATGLPPTTRLQIARQPERPLPEHLHDDVEDRLETILARRPDVLEAYAAAQAAHTGIDAAEAAFMPKVFLTGIAAVTNNRLNVNGLSFLGQPVSTAGAMLGVTVPLYDGGLRSRRLEAARLRADQAVETWRQTQEDAVFDVVSANNQLRSALEAYAAAQAWVDSADTAYDAALESYQYGLGTVDIAAEAANDRLTARMAEVDAYHAALAAATRLAHATGELTSRDAGDTIQPPGFEAEPANPAAASFRMRQR